MWCGKRIVKAKPWARRWLMVVALVLASLSSLCWIPVSAANGPGWAILSVEGQKAHIFRDAYGVPHIFAPTNYSLFYTYGYAVAQDRLWQLDLFRRAARGMMAEVLGPAGLASDRSERLHGYTETEYQDLYAALPTEAQEILTAYADGINAHLNVTLADPDHELPWEFHQLSYEPAPWKVSDTLAIGRFMARTFGETGGQELQSQALLQSLINAHGTITGTATFQDLHWLNDPDAPVSVPPEGTAGTVPIVPHLILPDIDWIAAEVGAQREAAAQVWARYGLPTGLGSYAWAVSPSRSATGNAMLFGGPQMGFNTPDIVHEIQLTGGRGFDVIGASFPGVPLVLVGHNRSVAWSVTSGMGDNADVYVETLNPLNPEEYWYDGGWRTMITRTETIAVQGWADPLTEVMRRTVHGPVIAMDQANGLAYSVRRAHWMREQRVLATFLDLNRAEDLDDFQRGIDQFEVSNNFLYADTAGNIAYWQAGAIPIRPDGGHVGRFPLPGDGTQEWTGRFRAVPHVVNPAQGYLVNWNNKASVDFDNGDGVLLGKQDRVSDIQEILAASASITWDDMQMIPVRVATLKLLGNETRYVRAYLLAAIAAEAPDDQRVQEVASRLAAWDGRAVADAVAGTQGLPEEEIWNTWLSRVLLDTFGDELGSSWSEANLNTLLHVLDGTTSGVPPSRDYFDHVGTDPSETGNQVLVQSLRGALEVLTARFGTSDIDSWTTARPTIDFVHPLGLVLGEIPLSNRATYAQIVELSTPIVAANIIPLGQSGFISPAGVPDPHFGDQITLYREFQYKPMQLITLYSLYLPAVLRNVPTLSVFPH